MRRREFLKTVGRAGLGAAAAAAFPAGVRAAESAARPEVRTRAGRLSGVEDARTLAFLGVPYAAPPLGKLRWMPPAAALPWSGVRAATQRGPVAPQLAHKLDDLWGGVGTRAQNEDCLTLNVWTPALDGAKRPVLVWFHGGAFVTGAGSLPGFSGAALAASGDLVVVTLNYRLGPLGWLHAPELSPAAPANFGLLDQAAALQWVHDEIAGFGGDPAQVTIAGQSAGAASVVLHMARPASRALFRRAIIESAPFAAAPRRLDEGGRITQTYAEALGVPVAGLRDVPVDRLLAAMGQVKVPNTGLMAELTPPFAPVNDGVSVLGGFLDAPAAKVTSGIDVLIGTNRDEMAAWMGRLPQAQGLSRAGVMRNFAVLFRERASEAYDVYAEQRRGAAPAQLLADAMSDAAFRIGTLRFAELQEAAGRPAYVYRFDWPSPAYGGVLGACHGLEMPFVFGPSSWTDAHMLDGADAAAIGDLARRVSRAWIAFVRSGNPNHDALPAWEPYRAEGRATLLLDREPQVVADAGGAVRGLWKKE